MLTYAQRIPALTSGDGRHRRRRDDRELRTLAADRVLVAVLRRGPEGARAQGLDRRRASRDLNGTRMCAANGSTNIDNLKNYPKIKVVPVDNISNCMVLFQQGTVDSVTGDDTVLAGFVAQDPYTKIIGAPLTSEPYGLGVSLKHPEFVRFVNRVLEQVRANGTWKQMYSHWLAADGPGSRASPRALRPEPVSCADDRHGTGVERTAPSTGQPHGRTGLNRRARLPRGSGRVARRRSTRRSIASTAIRSSRATPTRTSPTSRLAMSLYQSLATRHDELVATWDSGRVGRDELAQLAVLDVGSPPRSARRAVRVHARRSRHARRRAHRSARGRALERRRCGFGRRRPDHRDPSCHRAVPDPGRGAQAFDRLASTGSRPGSTAALASKDRERIVAVVTATDAEISVLENDLIKETSLRTSTARLLAELQLRYSELEERATRIAALAERCRSRIADPPNLAVPSVAGNRSTARGATPPTRRRRPSGRHRGPSCERYRVALGPMRRGPRRSRGSLRRAAPRSRIATRACSAPTAPGPPAPDSRRTRRWRRCTESRTTCCGPRPAISSRRAGWSTTTRRPCASRSAPKGCSNRGPRETPVTAQHVRRTWMHRRDRGRLLQRLRHARPGRVRRRDVVDGLRRLGGLDAGRPARPAGPARRR